MKEVNSRLNSTTAGLAYSVNVVVYFIINLIVALIIVVGKIPTGSDGYTYITYIAAPIALAVGCGVILIFKKQKIREVAPVKCHYKYYIIAFLMIFGLLFALSKLNGLTIKLLELLGYTARENSSYLPSVKGGLIVPVLLVIAVLPAISEEFLFRGIISRNARESVGDIRAILITGFCFSLFHGSPEQTVYQFISGCAFSFLAIRAGSILPCIMMHFLNNGIIIVLYACGATGAGGDLLISQTGNIILTVVAALAFVGSVVWLVLDKKPLKQCGKGGVAKFFTTASVGIVTLALVWILSFFGV